VVAPSPKRPLAFTLRSQGRLARVLHSPCRISLAADIANLAPALRPKTEEFVAIWDTGATGSVITQRVIDKCELKTIGVAKVHGVQGESITSRHLVNILLPNTVTITDVTVTLGNLPAQADVLIGMDVIGLGDFAVSNFKGETVFTFRCPSIACTDYVQESLTVAAKLARATAGPGGFSGGHQKGSRHRK